MKNDTPRILSVPVKSGGEIQRHSFTTLQELHDWLQSENEKWAWLTDRSPSTIEYYSEIRGNFSELTAALTTTRELILEANSSDRDEVGGFTSSIDEVAALQSALDKFSESDSIYSWTEHGRNILQLFNSGACTKDFATYAFLSIRGKGFEVILRRIVSGIEGIRDHLTPEFIGAAAWAKLSITGLPTETSHIAAEAIEHLHRTRSTAAYAQIALNEAKNSQQQAAQVSESLNNQVERWRTDHEAIFTKTHEHHTLTLDQLRSEFYEHLALNSASQYWSAEHERQVNLMDKWGRMCGAWGGVICAILLLKMSYLWCYPPTQVATKENLLGYVITFTAPFAIIVGLAIWALRILIRTYLSHAHLAADARERELLVTSCVALLRSAEIVNATENKELRSQILGKALESVFRHTQDGMVKDDAFTFAGIPNLVR